MGGSQSSKASSPKEGGSPHPTPKENADASKSSSVDTTSPDTKRETPPPSSNVTTPTEQTSDSDKQILEDYLNDSSEQSIPLNKVLSSAARVLMKFSTDPDMVVMVTEGVVNKCLLQLPPEPPAQIMELQMNALEAFSQLDLTSNPHLVDPAMNIIIKLWPLYSSILPAACNIKQLSHILNAALRQEDPSKALSHGSDFVANIIVNVSESQALALENEGVGKSLRSLLHHYDVMSESQFRGILAALGIFAEVKMCAKEFLEENLFPSLMLAAQKFADQSTIQSLLWRVLIVFCLGDKSFPKSIADMELLPAIVTVLKNKDAEIFSILRFLTVCLQVDSRYYSLILSHNELLSILLLKVQADSHQSSAISDCVDFLALLCSKCSIHCLPKLLELKLAKALEDAACANPKAALLPACIAVEGYCLLLSSAQGAQLPNIEARIDEFYAMDHHLFLQSCLSNPVIYEDPGKLDMAYLILQKLLKLITPEAHKRMCNQEFLEVFAISFVRDTSIPQLSSRVAFACHYFTFQIRDKESMELLRENNFHTMVIELVRTGNYDTMCTAMGLLSCLINKFFEYLKDIKPFLEAGVPALLLEKAKVYGAKKGSAFGEEMSRMLLNLTAEKELSLRLYNEGILDELLSGINDSYTPVVKRCMIHAIGNIALAGQNVKEVVLERNFHMDLLAMLNKEADEGDCFQLSACCRVLHILASGDATKRQFVESNCMDVLLRVMDKRKDNPEICWRPLGLLSTLGFMALVNRHCIVTPEVMAAVVKVLKENKHGKVLGYTMLVFLACLEMDSGAIDMRAMGIQQRIREVTQDREYQKQSTELERWGNHVLEKQDLYTVATPSIVPGSSVEYCSVSDWPVKFNTRGEKLVPQEERYFGPQVPTAFELSTSAKDQLTQLGISPEQGLFRVGRVYGSTYGWCSNCEREGSSYELVIRVQGMTPTHYQHLIDNGWYRRGGVKMFRMMQNHSLKCCDWETRVMVSKFEVGSHKSYKKVLRRMPTDRLTVETLPRHFSKEAFDLYNQYHIIRHDKPQKSEFSYSEHVVDSPIANQTIDGVEYGTFHQLYRLDGKLVAMGIVDIVPKGMVSIYMWYDVSKEIAKYSFGVYSALKEIEMVQERNKADPSVMYYYLQGWNPNNNKLSYKANYQPEEFLAPGISGEWLSSKEEVEAATEALRLEKTADQKQETTPDTTEDKDQTDSGETKPEVVSEDGKTKDSKEEDSKVPLIPCEAIDKDRLKHEHRTGSTTFDVSKIIVCINYTEYMYLGTLFEKYQVEEKQRELMKKRYEELCLSLCPELTQQLVIDLKACQVNEAMQLGVSVDPPEQSSS